MIKIFQQPIHNQYFLVCVAVFIVVLIKWVMVKRAYNKKMASFIHPSQVIKELKTKVKSVDDAQQLIAFNLFKLEEDYSRLRNIAFLIAYLKQFKAPVGQLQGKVLETFGKLDKDKLTRCDKLYRDYVVQEIEKDKCDDNIKEKGKGKEKNN